MACYRWVVAAAVVSGFVARDAVAQETAPLTVMVAIHNAAAVADEELAIARGAASAAFARAGVAIQWAGGRSCTADPGGAFCVQVLLRPRNAQSAPGTRSVMGMALAADHDRAVLSIYFDAVTDVARRYGFPRGKVLGLSLTHEMGHVLLPPPSHSTTGIMQPSWEGDELRHILAGDAAFTDEQALAVRTRLSARR
jgi:hypothetical protein